MGIGMKPRNSGGKGVSSEHFIPVCRMVFSKKLSLAGEDFIEVKYKPNYIRKAFRKPMYGG